MRHHHACQSLQAGRWPLSQPAVVGSANCALVRAARSQLHCIDAIIVCMSVMISAQFSLGTCSSDQSQLCRPMPVQTVPTLYAIHCFCIMFSGHTLSRNRSCVAATRTSCTWALPLTRSMLLESTTTTSAVCRQPHSTAGYRLCIPPGTTGRCLPRP